MIALLATILLSIAPSAAAQADALVQVVESGDEDAQAGLTSRDVLVGWVDLDNDNEVDISLPNEPVYLDLDSSRGVSFGDLRLSPFIGYPANTAVNHTNRDRGMALTEARGWFADDGSGTWYIDMDGDREVGPGDIRLNGDLDAGKVEAQDSDTGTSINRAQVQVRPGERAGTTEQTANPYSENFYLDLGGDGQVSIGDLRFPPSELTAEDRVFRTQLKAAMAGLQAMLDEARAALQSTDADLEDRLDDQGDQIDGNGATLSTHTQRLDEHDQELETQASGMEDAESSRQTWDFILLGLGIVNLIGLGAVAYILSRRGGGRSQRQHPPQGGQQPPSW